VIFDLIYMNTNNTFKSNEESLSHNFQDSNLKVNENSSSISSALISHGEISSKTNKFTEEAGIGCPLISPNNTHPSKETNRLAVTWCELLLNQMQETQSIQILRRDFEAKLNENIVS